jgi:hypothetical protein
MTVDLEADLRSEFNAATPPSTLTFHPESIVRLGNRTIRRRRIIAVGSAAMAVALVATGASLLTRPHDTAAPQPATRTATSGIVKHQLDGNAGTFEVEFDRDTRVQSNVHYFFRTKDGRRQEIGSSSTGKPGQKPDAVWRSGIYGGHPVTIGLVPYPDYGSRFSYVPTIIFADGGSYGVGIEELKGTGFSMFYVDYTPNVPGDPARKEPRRPSEIASIRWNGPTGIVDGIEGDHRLTGRVLTFSKTLSIEVVLRPGDGGRSTVFGMAYPQERAIGIGFDLSVATTDPSGAVVVTGRQPLLVKVSHGQPIAAGILAPGASDIGVILTTGVAPDPIVVSEVLADGRVIFAVKVKESAELTGPSEDSIKAITWTNADGTQGRMNVTQKP